MTTMTAPPNTEKPKLVLTHAHYEALAGSPPKLPTQRELFDYQVEGLVSRQLAQYADADPFRNRLPETGLFLLLPPPPKVLDLAELMALVVLDGKTGVNYLSVNSLVDLVEVPATASLLLDVEDGRARLNIKPMVSREEIKKEKRHPYTTWRGIVHAILFPYVLNHHNMDLVGSYYKSGRVPKLYLHDGGPKLSDNWEGNADPEWGAPSCGSVLVPRSLAPWPLDRWSLDSARFG